jgi:beta-lactamase class A
MELYLMSKPLVNLDRKGRGVTEDRIQAELGGLFASRTTKGFLYAVDLANGREVGLNAEAPVVTASVFKIAVVLEYTCQVTEGILDATDRVRVTPDQRVHGPTGLSTFSDEAELSLRDLAVSMMSVSDNTATDVLMERVGIDRINARLGALGLDRTYLVGDCADIISSVIEDAGLSEEAVRDPSMIPPEILRRCRALDPARTTRTTAREIATLLRLIADDQAGPAGACAEIRRIMALQIWPHRLRSGFPDGVRIWAKTGTLPGVRNEAGVIEYPDGGRYAVAVFTRSDSFAETNPPVDRVIGEAAATAVRALRS